MFASTFILSATVSTALGVLGASDELPAAAFSATPIAHAVGIADAKAHAVVGQTVTVIGKIGGSRKPFAKGRPIFTVVDLKLDSCDEDPDDACELPWDYCCEEKTTLTANTATLEFVDGAGKLLGVSAEGSHGLVPLAIVTATGVVREKTPTGAFTIDVQQIHVLPPKSPEPAVEQSGDTSTPPAVANGPHPGLGLTLQPLNAADEPAQPPVDPWADPATGAVVLLFLTPDCPIGNAFQPEIKRLQLEFESPATRFFAVYPDVAIDAAKAREHRRIFEFAAQFPTVLDAQQLIAGRFGVTVVPEAVVLTRDGTMVYRGRINDLYERIGVRKAAATSQDLRDTLSAIASGKPPTPRTTQAIGCIVAAPKVPAPTP